MNKISIIFVYLIGGILIIASWRIHNSEYVNDLIKLSIDDLNGSRFYVFIYLVKYLLLLTGILTILTLTLHLIKENHSKTNDNITT